MLMRISQFLPLHCRCHSLFILVTGSGRDNRDDADSACLRRVSMSVLRGVMSVGMIVTLVALIGAWLSVESRAQTADKPSIAGGWTLNADQSDRPSDREADRDGRGRRDGNGGFGRRGGGRGGFGGRRRGGLRPRT